MNSLCCFAPTNAEPRNTSPASGLPRPFYDGKIFLCKNRASPRLKITRFFAAAEFMTISADQGFYRYLSVFYPAVILLPPSLAVADPHEFDAADRGVAVV